MRTLGLDIAWGGDTGWCLVEDRKILEFGVIKPRTKGKGMEMQLYRTAYMVQAFRQRIARHVPDVLAWETGEKWMRGAVKRRSRYQTKPVTLVTAMALASVKVSLLTAICETYGILPDRLKTLSAATLPILIEVDPNEARKALFSGLLVPGNYVQEMEKHYGVLKRKTGKWEPDKTKAKVAAQLAYYLAETEVFLEPVPLMDGEEYAPDHVVDAAVIAFYAECVALQNMT